jgi:hypothetical protein
MESKEAWIHAWLLAQLCAMERRNALIAIGGKLTGPMSLLLRLAETQRKSILPLRFLRGSAAQCFEKQRYQLEDRLDGKLDVLTDPQTIDRPWTLCKN